MVSCKFNVKKCLSCPKYNSCLLQTSYVTNMTLIDTINSIIMVQQNIVKDITEIKESQKIISEDNDKIIQNIQSITDNIQTIENNLTTLVNSYEIVN